MAIRPRYCIGHSEWKSPFKSSWGPIQFSDYYRNGRRELDQLWLGRSERDRFLCQIGGHGYFEKQRLFHPQCDLSNEPKSTFYPFFVRSNEIGAKLLVFWFNLASRHLFRWGRENAVE